MFNVLKKSRPAFSLMEQLPSSHMLLIIILSSRYDSKPMLAVALVMSTEMIEKLKKLRPLSPTVNQKYVDVSLKILDAAKVLHQTYTLEELHDFVFFKEVPQRKISPERLTTHLWEIVKEHWSATKAEGELAEILVSPAFQQKLQSGSCSQ